MNPAEYLAFIPLLLYGGSLVELLSQWRRFFDKEYLYLPYFLTTIIFTEMAIWNVFIYLGIASQLNDMSYYRYWPYLLQPIIFLLTVHALTPDKGNKDTAGYFKRRISVIFGLMAAYIACHFLPGFSVSEDLDYPRLVGIGLCLLIAVWRKVYLVYGLVVIWIISLFFR